MYIGYLLLCKKNTPNLHGFKKTDILLAHDSVGCPSWGQLEQQGCVPRGLGWACLRWLQFGQENLGWCHSLTHTSDPSARMTQTLGPFYSCAQHSSGPLCPWDRSSRLARTSFHGGSRLQESKKGTSKAFHGPSQLYNITIASATFSISDRTCPHARGGKIDGRSGKVTCAQGHVRWHGWS